MGSAPDPLAIALSWRARLLWTIGAVASFHLAYGVPVCSLPLATVFFVGLLQLSRSVSRRVVIYNGLLVGLSIYGPQLFFFWSIFRQGAIVLWLVLASWLVVYLLLQQLARQKYGALVGTLSAPMWWLAVEYFRSELYPLRFSWLNTGYLSPSLSGLFGMYGAGFFLMLVAAGIAIVWTRLGWMPTGLLGLGVVAIITGAPILSAFHTPRPGGRLTVAGVQFEEGSTSMIVQALDKLWGAHPEASVFVLSEYSFDDEVPAEVREWCALRQRWLVAGGKHYLDPGKVRYRNTAFVIGPEGREVFQQAKSRPIQFFDDGLPAEGQAVWSSPWGDIGLCICYDLSYTRVTDELIRRGAQMIIVPTMDVEGWGEREHRLHARVAPVRAAECGVPIFRLCSSGISQVVNAGGHVQASAPFPGQGETLVGTFNLRGSAAVPLDRTLAWSSMAVSAAVLLWSLWTAILGRRKPNTSRQSL